MEACYNRTGLVWRRAKTGVDLCGCVFQLGLTCVEEGYLRSRLVWGRATIGFRFCGGVLGYDSACV